MTEERKSWLDSPGNVTKLLWLFYALCAVMLVAELFIHKHAQVAAEGWFGFYGIYGFVGIVALVLLAKILRRLVGRREDYYER